MSNGFHDKITFPIKLITQSDDTAKNEMLQKGNHFTEGK